MNEFSDRLQFIFKKYSVNAASFADKIGVQRSNLSHIISGRNKPSLDLILKIYQTYPEINLNWLALGEGEFYKNVNSFDELTESKITNHKPSERNDTENTILKNSINNKEDSKKENVSVQTNNQFSPAFFQNSEIDQILIFYKDGTFKSYIPR